MIHIKNGGVSEYKKLRELNVKAGDTLLSQDGTVLVIIRPSCWVSFIRLCDQSNPPIFPTESTISAADSHHSFKRVEVDLIIRSATEQPC